MVPDSFPTFLSWMPGADDVLIFEDNHEAGSEVILQADLIFCLDYNHLGRVAQMGEVIARSSALKVLIDHHIDPAEGFDAYLSDTSASSTAELVFKFSENMGWKSTVNEAIAQCLYAGIMTDTGSFKFSSTSAYTHYVASFLIEQGLKPTDVHHQIFDTNSLQRLRLLGYALSEKLEFDADKGVAIISLSQAEKSRFDYQKGDTEGLVNYGLSIEGASVAVLLSEENGYTKFSFRSKGQIDVNIIARTWFNGGGHKNAAGGKLDMQLPAALKKLKDVFENNPI